MKTSDNKFRDKMGRWHTQALFVECHQYVKGMKPMYTLNEYKGYPSIKKAFLDYEDPTGYKVATEWLGGYDHWKKLCSLKWFREHLEQWEEELEVKMKCKAISKMNELAAGDNAVAKDASKFLVNKEWEGKRGRPTKAEIEKNTKVNTRVSNVLESDFKLLNLHDSK